MKAEDAILNVEAYKDLDNPVILTSGELGIYYINTEKLLEDSGEWEKYGEDPLAMIKHSIGQKRKSINFDFIVNRLASEITSKISALKNNYREILISGGQRRDWIFSGPVAEILNLRHVAIFKDGKASISSSTFNELLPLKTGDLNDCYLVHVVDLLTLGSSAYNPNMNPATGWIVDLRSLGAEIDSLYSVVDRNQGAGTILQSVAVSALSLVTIDREFLGTRSKFPQRALEYFQDSHKWAESYISNNSISTFLDYFDPAKGKQDRALRFVKTYKEILLETGKLAELSKLIKEKYDYLI